LQRGSFRLLKIGLIGQQFDDDFLRLLIGFGFDSGLQSTRRIIAVVRGNPPAVVVVCKGYVFGDDQLLDDDFMTPCQSTIARLEGAQGEMSFLIDGAARNPSRGLRIGCDHSAELDRPQSHWFSIRKADQSVDRIGCFLLWAASQDPSQGDRYREKDHGMVEPFSARKLLQSSDSVSVKQFGCGI